MARDRPAGCRSRACTGGSRLALYERRAALDGVAEAVAVRRSTAPRRSPSASGSASSFSDMPARRPEARPRRRPSWRSSGSPITEYPGSAGVPGQAGHGRHQRRAGPRLTSVATSPLVSSRFVGELVEAGVAEVAHHTRPLVDAVEQVAARLGDAVERDVGPGERRAGGHAGSPRVSLLGREVAALRRRCPPPAGCCAARARPRRGRSRAPGSCGSPPASSAVVVTGRRPIAISRSGRPSPAPRTTRPRGTGPRACSPSWAGSGCRRSPGRPCSRRSRRPPARRSAAASATSARA